MSLRIPIDKIVLLADGWHIVSTSAFAGSQRLDIVSTSGHSYISKDVLSLVPGTQASGTQRDAEHRSEHDNSIEDKTSLRPEPGDFASCACGGEIGVFARRCDHLGHIAYLAHLEAEETTQSLALCEVAVMEVMIESGHGYLSDAEGLAIAAHTRRTLHRPGDAQ